MLARLGQHHEFVTKPLSKLTPCCTSWLYTFGMISGVTVPIRWSSVTTTRMFGASDRCLRPDQLPRLGRRCQPKNHRQDAGNDQPSSSSVV
jgi:hypothetical protein